MSKRDELAVSVLLEIDPHTFGYAAGGKEINAITGHYREAFNAGWDSCLKHDESVKELVEALEKLKDNAVGEGCMISYPAREVLSKFREKVGE